MLGTGTALAPAAFPAQQDASGSSTAVGASVQMRQFGHPAVTANDLDQPTTNCTAPATTMMRAAVTAPRFFASNSRRTRSGMKMRSGGSRTREPTVASSVYRRIPANTRVRSPCSQSRVCSVSITRRTGADTALKPCCGACATLKYATCVADDTTPSTIGVSVLRSETAPVAPLDCRTNRTISGESSPSSRTGATGKRRNACQPATPIASDAIA
jgi:hypothetical protein